MPIAELQNFRTKYPQYSDISDGDLAQKLATKYPEYSDLVGKVGGGRQISSVPESEFQSKNVAMETAKGTIGTIARSGGSALKAIGQSVRHPIDTANSMLDVGFGAVQHAILPKNMNTPEKQMASSVAQDYRQHYGSMDRFAQTVAEDPFRFVGDASMLASGPLGKRGVSAAAKTLEAVPAAGKAIAKVPINAAKFGAERTINSMVKPLLKNFSYGKNPGAVAYEKITANSWPDWINKLGQKADELGQKIKKQTDASSVPVTGVDQGLNKVFAPAIQKAASQNDTALVKRLTESYRAITEDLAPAPAGDTGIGIISKGSKNLSEMTPSEALALKRHIGELAKWEGKPSEDKLVNATIQNAYRVVRRKLEVAVPGIKKLNERYANIASAKQASIYREQILKRHDIVGLGAKGLAGMEVLLNHGSPESILKAAAIIGLGKAAASPFVKTRFAAALAKLSEAEQINIFKKNPSLKAVVGRTNLNNNRGSFEYGRDASGKLAARDQPGQLQNDLIAAREKMANLEKQAKTRKPKELSTYDTTSREAELARLPTQYAKMLRYAQESGDKKMLEAINKRINHLIDVRMKTKK